MKRRKQRGTLAQVQAAQSKGRQKKFSRKEQEAWGMTLTGEAEKSIRTKTNHVGKQTYRLPDSQLNELFTRTLLGIHQLKKHGATKGQLNKLRSALDAAGTKRGPKPGTKKNERLLTILRGLSEGKQLKATVADVSKAGSESAQFSRRCIDFYDTASMFEETGVDIWKDPYTVKVFKDRYGFELPAHLAYAREAYKIGHAYYQRPRRHRPSRRQQPTSA
jgi:hypothetical protein